MKRLILLGLLSLASTLNAQDSDVQKLERKLDALREEYEQRLQSLERELESLRGEPETSASEEPSSQPATSELEKLRDEAEAFAAQKEDEQAPVRTEADSHVWSLNAFNPRLTVYGDFLGRIDSERVFEDEEEISDRFSLREVEIDLRADIDPYAKGVMILAAEEHQPNDYELTIEEGYLDLHTLPGLEELPLNLTLKLGRFRTDFGLANRLHTHDLPWVSRPLALEAFLGEEGDIGNGLGLEYLLHNPWEEAITLGFQLVNRESSVFQADNSDDLAYLGRLSWHKQLSFEHELQLGSSLYFDDRGDFLLGTDAYYRWRPSSEREQTSLVLQTEWYLRQGPVDLGEDVAEDGMRFLDEREQWGAYVSGQFQFLKNYYLGARYDYLSNLRGVENEPRWKAAAYVSLYTSEFLRFRLGYEHEEGPGPDNDTVYLQITWAFGSHPPHPYWVNR